MKEWYTCRLKKMAGQVVISVVSDLVTDQRVHRTALTLHNKGLKVTLVGRKMRSSAEVDARPYSVKRFRLPVEKGPLFYAFYNLRLLCYLLFRKCDVLVANDLDTILPNFLIARLKGCKLYYDSHEYFTEVPELVNRPRIQKIWLSIERRIFPKLKNVFTVNDSIAKIYSAKYHVKVDVVRNLPIRNRKEFLPKSRSEFGIPTDKPVFLFQGAGINIDRGAEEAIQAISLLSDAVLLFIGGGDVIDLLRKKVDDENLNHKVFFIGKKPLSELPSYTALADFGLTLDKDTNLNYKYSLPNKLFDYINAGLPVLATDLPEVRKIVTDYQIGLITPSSEPHILAESMEVMVKNRAGLDLWKENLKIAAAELCWENEEKKLLEVFRDVVA